MTIFPDDILNLEFTTNLRRGIPVSVQTKGQKGSFRHQARCGKRCTKCEVCEKGLTATKRGKNERRGKMMVIHSAGLQSLSTHLQVAGYKITHRRDFKTIFEVSEWITESTLFRE